MQSETDCNNNQDNLNKIEQQIIFTIETQAQLSSSPNTLARSLSHKTQNTNSNKLILLLSLQLKDYKLWLDKAKVNTNEFQVNRNQKNYEIEVNEVNEERARRPKSKETDESVQKLSEVFDRCCLELRRSKQLEL